MSVVPSILGERRGSGLALVAFAGVGQALGLGLVAFTMRDVFKALYDQTPLAFSVLATLATAGVLIVGLNVASRTIAERVGQSYVMALRHRLYQHLAHMPRSEITKRRSGAIGLRFVGDFSAARNWVSQGIAKLFSAVFVLPGAAIALYLLNPSLAAAVAAPIVLTLVAMVFAALLLQPLHRRLRSKRANIAISMMERAAVAPELNLLGRTALELRSLDADSIILKDLAVKRVRARSGLAALPDVGSAIAGASLLWSASVTGASGAEAAGALAVLGILIVPLRDLSGVWDRRCAWAIAREKYAAILESEPAKKRRLKTDGPVDVRFESVRFREVSVNAIVHAGEIVLVTGDTGAGKSTFMTLAAGLDLPEHGHIHYGQSPRPPRMAFVGPRAPILQGSLRRAFVLGVKPRPDDDEILDAAKRFGLEELLERTGGLDARVGEAGRSLSSGERLRLLLARAALSKPDLLVIDAPEISLDPPASTALLTLLRETRATAFIVSSDQSLVGVANRLLHVNDGRVTEKPLPQVAEVRGMTRKTNPLAA